jgi:hypothetical protein
MKRGSSKPLTNSLSGGNWALGRNWITELTEQDKLQKYVLESILGRYSQPQRVNEQANTWRLWVEVEADVRGYADDLVNHPQIEMIDVIEHGKSWFEVFLRFNATPRIVYDETQE